MELVDLVAYVGRPVDFDRLQHPIIFSMARYKSVTVFHPCIQFTVSSSPANVGDRDKASSSR